LFNPHVIYNLSRSSLRFVKCSTNMYPTKTMHMIVRNIASADIQLILNLVHIIAMCM